LKNNKQSIIINPKIFFKETFAQAIHIYIYYTFDYCIAIATYLCQSSYLRKERLLITFCK